MYKQVLQIRNYHGLLFFATKEHVINRIKNEPHTHINQKQIEIEVGLVDDMGSEYIR